MSHHDKDSEATTALESLAALANHMIPDADMAESDRRGSTQRTGHSRHRPPITFVVGAGASATAALPGGRELKGQIRDVLREKSIPDALIEREMAVHFPKKCFSDLSLFEYASLVTSFAWGRELVRDHMERILGKATHRPLAYELIAHLAKHRFIDNVISFNFDELLDEAVRDELAGRGVVVGGEGSVPLRVQRDRCYLIKPFGSLGASDYRISVSEVRQLGTARVSELARRSLLGHREDSGIRPVIVLVGYRAAEEGFQRMIESLPRPPIFFVINRSDELQDKMRNESWVKHPFFSIRLDADLALDLLLEVLARRWRRPASWVPPGRHRILARCSAKLVEPPNEEAEQAHPRFALELLLQGMKSRGFVHVESFGRVERLRKYSTRFAAQQVEGLLREGVLVADRWLGERVEVAPEAHYAPNYMITKPIKELAEWMIRKFKIGESNGRMAPLEWELEGPEVRAHEVSLQKYVEKQLEAIQGAPDIEIDPDGSPVSGWPLGEDAVRIESVDSLIQRSQQMLEAVQSSGGLVRGIWSTGEWLFNKKGWAFALGRSLLQQKNVTFEVILTDAGGAAGARSKRRQQVIRRLQGLSSTAQASVSLRFVDWWDLNRVLTICEVGQKRGGARKQGGAIYFRRRLGQPVVQPYWIDFAGRRGRTSSYLEEVWAWYWARARRDVTKERITVSMKEFREATRMAPQRGRAARVGARSKSAGRAAPAAPGRGGP